LEKNAEAEATKAIKDTKQKLVPNEQPSEKPKSLNKKDNAKPKQLSDSSESESDEENKSKPNLMGINEIPLELSLSDEYQPEKTPIKKPTKKQEVAKAILPASEILGPKTTPPLSSFQLIKNAFNKHQDFEKSVNEFTKIYNERKLGKIPQQLPQIIPAPQEDPSKRVIKKKKKKVPAQEPQHPEAHLGGIFTINNGWEKINVEEKEVEMPKVIVPRDQRSLPKVSIVALDQDLSDELDEFDRHYLSNQISFEEVDEEVLDWNQNQVNNSPLSDDASNDQSGSEEMIINETLQSPNEGNEDMMKNQDLQSPPSDENDKSSVESAGQVVPTKPTNQADNCLNRDEDEIAIDVDYG
jgi:hypothetical protein